MGLNEELQHMHREIRAIKRGIMTILDRLQEINLEEGSIMRSGELQKLQDQVAANNDLIGSAVTLIGGLAEQLRAAKDDPAAIEALADSLKASDEGLAAALAANTPAAPAPAGSEPAATPTA
jgi:hypothetical protein